MEQINLEASINETKKLMTEEDNTFSPFTKYSPFYFHTNEDFKMSLRNLEFNKERALSVMASGDQVFNLIYLGVKDIDAFDINVLTYFVYYLRRAIFLAYGYENSPIIESLFCLNFTNPEKLLEILKTLKPFMSDDVYIYFEEILKYNSYLSPSREYNSFSELCRDIITNGKNLYDKNGSSFKIFQDNLDNSTLTFQNCSIEKLPNLLDKSYDIMHFSNISEYFIKEYGKKGFLELMWQFYPYLKKRYNS